MIQVRSFGKFEGRDVIEATLRSDVATVSILNYGCVVRDWQIRHPEGPISVVLGFDEFASYPLHSPYFGAIAGRVANRTARGRFQIKNTKYQLPVNDGINHLHGGISGLSGRIWELETDDASNSIQLSYHSEDGEEGYPAAVRFTVTYRLQGARLTCEMTGMPNAPTPINLAQHNYYNLNGTGNVRGHLIQIAARSYTPVDKTQIPTGEILTVENSRFDFTRPTTFEATDPSRIGVDHNLVMDPKRDVSKPSATLYSPQSNLELKLWTDEPGLQVYNAPNPGIPVTGLNGTNYGAFMGVCLEAQHFPDSLNRPEWPSIICTSDEPYAQKLVVEIGRR